jgi:hypothetical protein
VKTHNVYNVEIVITPWYTKNSSNLIRKKRHINGEIINLSISIHNRKKCQSAIST